jgi:hypothetical protein
MIRRTVAPFTVMRPFCVVASIGGLAFNNAKIESTALT